MNAPACAPTRHRPDSLRYMRGARLLELIIVLIIVGIVSAGLFERTLLIQMEAEKTSVTQIVGRLRAAVRMRVAEHVIKGRSDRLAALVGCNPMNFLAEKPANYVGELDAAPMDGRDSPVWYFDRIRRILVYLPQEHRWFGDEPQKTLNLKVRLPAPAWRQRALPTPSGVAKHVDLELVSG